MKSISTRIAEELKVAEIQVKAAVALLDEGSTVPFIARYRKEVTGGLDDVQLRTLSERLIYLRELEERRAAILKSIESQEKLTPELEKAIKEADTKTRLEDLYLPYKPKRQTKGQIAIKAGLEPLADSLYSNPNLDPEQEAVAYINTDPEFKDAFKDVKGVLEGARYILMERFAEDADLLGELRAFLNSKGQLVSKVLEGKEEEGAKFRDYFDNRDALHKIPSHRALAMFRGRNEGILDLSLDVEYDAALPHPCEAMIARRVGVENKNRPADAWLNETVRWTWRIKLQLHMETELLSELRVRAEATAIEVFATNLKDLLLAAPAGQKPTMGLDPGLRTGVKLAVIDHTGRFVDSATIYPHAPRNDWERSLAVLAVLAQKHNVKLLAIGNGTASRETDRLCAELIKRKPELGLQKVVVNEAGASVYSASELAAREFPDLDVTIRGAVSIARRLQDPLAELVKIDPKSIGVGQYQHDVSQVFLARNLDAVVEDCVNRVGVEVNTASAALLRRVAGLNPTLAENIVEARDQKGGFKSREDLRRVPRLGDKTFEQAAGFLRIRGGENPLDASAVHPESYPVVNRIAQTKQMNVEALIGNNTLLRGLNPADFVDERFGLPTVTDIIAELEKPGRDPRPAFETATFKEGVEQISDLEVNMILEGTVTNVTHFGAFVDIGVHQDGLVHISALADRFVSDPREVVKTGDIVRVKVLEVDEARKRIALTMRLDDRPDAVTEPDATTRGSKQAKGPAGGKRSEKRPDKPATQSAFDLAFSKAAERKAKG